MANNYEQATLTPYIQKQYITEEEAEILTGCGFTVESISEDRYYLYIEESFFDEDVATAVLQDVLKRIPEEEANILFIEGACTCTKMHQGEFGGWACVIYRDKDPDWENTGLWILRKIEEERERLSKK